MTIQAKKAMHLTYRTFSQCWLQLLKYGFRTLSMVFKVLMEWLFMMFFICYHDFFLFNFSLPLTSLLKKEEKMNKSFPKFYAARRKKESKICTSSLQKQEGVLGVIKHMLDNWYYPLVRYCSYLHSLKLHEWSPWLSIHTRSQWLGSCTNCLLGLLASPSSPTNSSCKVSTVMNLG